jgi:LacI family transcriptional regulator
MRATIRDVAEAAGVSAMAVSKVLHGRGTNVRVSDAKSELIRKVARELHYRPNQNARNFRNQKTNLIGIVFQHFEGLTEDNPYLPQMLNGVMAALFPAGYTMGICPKLVLDGSAPAIADGRFDGILWTRPDFSQASVDSFRYCGVPVVMLHAPPGSAEGIPAFCANNDLAMQRVIDHLTSLGHRKIAFMIDPIPALTAEGVARRDAFCTHAKLNEIEFEVILSDQTDPDLSAYSCDNRPHTAIVAYSDTQAAAILKAAEALGIRVPGDLSVVGFDSSSFCERTEPKLTSVFQPVEQMARDATNYLLTMVNDAESTWRESGAVTSLYDCHLDIRESTGPPNS